MIFLFNSEKSFFLLIIYLIIKKVKFGYLIKQNFDFF